MRKIAVITVARSDYGIYLPVLREINTTPSLELQIIASGMHLSPDFGMTVNVIEADGFAISARIDMELRSDTPRGIAHSMGVGTDRYADAYERLQSDIIVVLGDRFEMHAAAIAALPFKIPVAHIHGGELTFGAIDDAMRHSITKLSHLHFASTQSSADRIVRLGEAPWRVTCSGAPGLDNLNTFEALSRGEMTKRFGLNLEQSPLLVTFHPATLEFDDSASQVNELLAALSAAKLPVVMTLPNADTSSREVIRLMRAFAEQHAQVQMVDNLGTQGYFTLMSMSRAMVGNSSSGIIESPSFALPVVNIGLRQEGRERARNVIDVGSSREEIGDAIVLATSSAFRDGLSGLENPYGDGTAAPLIVETLAQAEIDDRLMIKRFYEPAEALGASG